MKSQVVPCILFSLTLTFSASAQRGSGGRPGIGSAGIPSRSRPSVPDLGNTPSIFLSGKVVLDDGSELTQAAAVQTICKGQKHTETYTDSRGNFSFEFVSKASSSTSSGFGEADTPMWSDPTSSRGNQRNFRDCELQASLSGFTSQVLELSMVASTSRNTDVGRVVLHRLEQVEGLTISATSAAAPHDAKQAFEKGVRREKEANWDEAQKLFEKAVRLYARYAVAWFELGLVQLQQHDEEGALHSFDQAFVADPKYVSPYHALMRLAVKEQRWPAVVDITGKLLALNPVSFPDAWFFNATGNYLLNNLPAAEKSARQGLRVDEEHHLPKLEYMLGMILIAEQKYTEAATHMRQYLQLAKYPSETDEAKKQLAEIDRLSASATIPALGDKR